MNKENLKKASEELKIDPTNNLNDIFDDEKIKAICICAPNKFHKELIIKGIKAGKHRSMKPTPDKLFLLSKATPIQA